MGGQAAVLLLVNCFRPDGNAPVALIDADFRLVRFCIWHRFDGQLTNIHIGLKYHFLRGNRVSYG